MKLCLRTWYDRDDLIGTIKTKIDNKSELHMNKRSDLDNLAEIIARLEVLARQQGDALIEAGRVIKDCRRQAETGGIGLSLKRHLQNSFVGEILGKEIGLKFSTQDTDTRLRERQLALLMTT